MLENYEVILVDTLAEILAADIPEKLQTLLIQAVKDVWKSLRYYHEQGYMPKLIEAISRKKCQLILTIKTKGEMEQLVKPRCPYYDGNQFRPDEYIVPEEELIQWSETSLVAPLNEIGFARYLELFKQIFPKESEGLRL